MEDNFQHLELPGTNKKTDANSNPKEAGSPTGFQSTQMYRTPSMNPDDNSGDEEKTARMKKQKSSQKLTKKSVPENMNLNLLGKAKIQQAQILLTRQKKLLEKSSHLINSNSLENKANTQENNDHTSSNVSSNSYNAVIKYTGEGEMDSGIVSNALNEGVKNVQIRLLVLKTEHENARGNEKLQNQIIEEVEKLNYFLFQASSLLAGIPANPEQRSLGNSLLKQSTPNLNNPKVQAPGESSPFLKSKKPLSRLGQSVSSIDDIESASKPEPNINNTTFSLSGPISQVIAQRSRQTAPVTQENSSRILSKRKIQELVSEIDPNERIEPEVEDLLCDIADEFIESVVNFSCQLAKHRKSNVLEAKDVQLHLERNWNIRIPGFASEEIRSVRKSNLPASYQQKLGAINSIKHLKRFD
ncbi:hypothetical protein BB558_001760 [Smittium angustum]|uniref:TBP-associated factor 12 n=1 Tax=Smittium angustum TaxID=133377 RepID=A0A2U1J1H2_SMIAN|nr:hypothetical protein BB558_005056 [Smittium angustum]PWA02104.1 hypothetical protein BB558_001760 [Smittium angustum]